MSAVPTTWSRNCARRSAGLAPRPKASRSRNSGRMRFVVYGVGAIGGCIAAALSLAGEEVAGIARGAQLEAIRERGLLLRTPNNTATGRFPCHADPSEIGIRDHDVILLTMKTQDTAAALER